jgi:DnaJ-class molecular chaperone
VEAEGGGDAVVGSSKAGKKKGKKAKKQKVMCEKCKGRGEVKDGKFLVFCAPCDGDGTL